MFIAKSIEKIRAFRVSRGWTLSKLAREAGLRESSIRDLDRDSWNPESKTLRKLETIIPSDFQPSAGEVAMEISAVSSSEGPDQ
ncbi:MAG TPA: helix-turn-helix transcriptional regulator [Dongiaceae bacterium]|nr:helix-turn-helix transcriptional regulator [Dongiaceae bacterium]